VNDKPTFTYAQSGVDTDIEAMAAHIMYGYSKQTWANRAGKLGEPNALADGFSGVRYASISGLPEGTVEWGNADGLGTKPEIARLAGRYDTIATDLIAMVADDAAIQGAEPAHVKTILTVNTLGQDQSRLHYIEDLGRGYVEPAAEAGVAVINGEIAQHNDSDGTHKEFRFGWEATLTWYAHQSRLIDGSKIQAGDYIVGLRETGLRCNGISLVRRIMASVHGPNWSEATLDGERLVDLALAPSRIYTKALVDITGGYDLNRPAKAVLHGAAHITGGGLPEKLVTRLLRKQNLGAIIDSPFEAPSLIKYLQELGNVDDHEAYKTWNMGQGMVLIVPNADDIIEICRSHNMEAKVIGRVTVAPEVTVHSRGLRATKLTF
jgi:phosphoribosylformylglycinamidine cyclo-ligase